MKSYQQMAPLVAIEGYIGIRITPLGGYVIIHHAYVFVTTGWICYYSKCVSDHWVDMLLFKMC